MAKWATGAVVPARELTTVAGELVPLPDPDRLTHLQFRRFAGCPVCHLHLRSVARRQAEIAAAGVREVVLFHSPVAELRPHLDVLPFDVIADPHQRLYREFGVAAGRRAVLDPRAWPAIVRGSLAVLRSRRGPVPHPRGGRLGLPADLLIGPDGRVLASHYGAHADDQWSVDELLDLARGTAVDNADSVAGVDGGAGVVDGGRAGS
jgi:peroxiredoxin